MPTTHCFEVYTADDDMFYDFMRESSEGERLDMLQDHGQPKLFKFDFTEFITQPTSQLIVCKMIEEMFDCFCTQPNVVHAVLYEDFKESDDPGWPSEWSGNVVDRWDIIESQATPSASAINEFIEDKLNLPDSFTMKIVSNGSPLLDKWALRCQDQFAGLILSMKDIGGIWAGGYK